MLADRCALSFFVFPVVAQILYSPLWSSPATVERHLMAGVHHSDLPLGAMDSLPSRWRVFRMVIQLLAPTRMVNNCFWMKIMFRFFLVQRVRHILNMPDGLSRKVRRHLGTFLDTSELLSQKADDQMHKLGHARAGRGWTWSSKVNWFQELLRKPPRLLSETSALQCCPIASLDTKSVT